MIGYKKQSREMTADASKQNRENGKSGRFHIFAITSN
jgi:hypothetical protein